MIIGHINNFMHIVWKREMKRFIKYCIIGMTGIIVNTIVLFIFTDKLGIFYLLSSGMAYEISIITNFILNDIWTFNDNVIHNRSHNFLTRAIYFNWAMIIGALFGIMLLYIFTEFLSIDYILSNIISIFIVTIWRYHASITLVWKIKSG